MSFNFNTMLRRGKWLEYRRFILNQRRNVPSRIRSITAELTRIGDLQILYTNSDPSDETSPMTERVKGIVVQEGSSIGKLLRAYIAQGGNPFDISMFLKPDTYKLEYNPSTDTFKRIDEYPYGGVVYPISVDEDDGAIGSINQAGWLVFWRYPARKLNSNSSHVHETEAIGRAFSYTRDWVRQEIKELRNDLEYKILTLCDLREQLLKELNETIPTAVGDVIYGVGYDVNEFSTDHHLSTIVNQIDLIFYQRGEDGFADFTKPRITTDSDIAFPSLVEDAYTGEEKWKALG